MHNITNHTDTHLNCPVCGKEMAYGYSTFNSNQGILWLPAETEMTLRRLRKIYWSHSLNANFVTSEKDAAAEVNGEWIYEPEPVRYPKIPCHLCRACKKIVLHYGEGEEYPYA